MRYLLILLLLVAGCQESQFQQAGNVRKVVWTPEHTRLFVAMGTDCQVTSLPFENIELEKE